MLCCGLRCHVMHVPACLPCPWRATQVLEGLSQKIVAAYMPLLHRLVDSLVRHTGCWCQGMLHVST